MYVCSNVAKLFEKKYIFKKKICMSFTNFIILKIFIFLSKNLFFSNKLIIIIIIIIIII